MQVILGEEDHPAKEPQTVCWLLVTSLLVSRLEDALRYLRWYSYRWLIERFHFLLKIGCGFEGLRLENGDLLKRALGITTKHAADQSSHYLRCINNVSSDLSAPSAYLLAQKRGDICVDYIFASIDYYKTVESSTNSYVVCLLLVSAGRVTCSGSRKSELTLNNVSSDLQEVERGSEE